MIIEWLRPVRFAFNQGNHTLLSYGLWLDYNKERCKRVERPTLACGYFALETALNTVYVTRFSLKYTHERQSLH